MIRSIRLENFMSHRDTTLELADGLNVLVGPNNCGKSAVVEALRVLCENPPSEVVVRHGEKVCRVTVQVQEGDDEHLLTWQRKSGTVSYEIDGREIHRLGRNTVPEDLHKYLRLPEVKVPGKEPVNVHFGQQKSPIFLLDRPGSEVAAFFSASSDAEKLLRMQQRHRQKVTEARGRQRDDTAELASLDQQLATLAPLQALAPQVEQLQTAYNDLRADQQAIERLAGQIDRMELTSAFRQQYAAQSNALAELQPAPKLDDESFLELLVDRQASTTVDIARESARLSALASIAAPPELDETSALESLLENLDRGIREQAHRSAEQQATASLTPPPEIEDEQALVDLGKALARARRAYDQAKQVTSALASLGDLPELQETAALETLLGRWDELEQVRAAARKQQQAAEHDLAEAQQSIQVFVLTNPQCPLCGAPISSEMLLAGGHAHA